MLAPQNRRARACGPEQHGGRNDPPPAPAKDSERHGPEQHGQSEKEPAEQEQIGPGNRACRRLRQARGNRGPADVTMLPCGVRLHPSRPVPLADRWPRWLRGSTRSDRPRIGSSRASGGTSSADRESAADLRSRHGVGHHFGTLTHVAPPYLVLPAGPNRKDISCRGLARKRTRIPWRGGVVLDAGLQTLLQGGVAVLPDCDPFYIETPR
jgi:hypothetical protein